MYFIIIPEGRSLKWVSRPASFPEALRADPFSCLFQLLEATCLPQLMARPPPQSQHLSIFQSLSDCGPPAFLLRGPLRLHGPTRVIQATLHSSRLLMSSHLQSPSPKQGDRLTGHLRGHHSAFHLPQGSLREGLSDQVPEGEEGGTTPTAGGRGS